MSGTRAVRPGRRWPRLGRVLHECLVAVAHFGNAVSGVSGFLLPYPHAGGEPAAADPPVVDPLPPGHPERLVPHAPLSAIERWLAAQLD